VAESSWPSPAASHAVADDQYEKLGLSFGPLGGVVGDFTSPQLVYGDSTGMQVKVAADRYALVRGHEWWSGSSILTKTIGANSSGSTRTDLVVLRLSRTTWDVTTVVIAGTPGAGAPAPTQNTGTTGSWDLPLATVTVANGAATITAGNVTYVAPHLDPSGGGYRAASAAALAYIPAPLAGMEATLTDGTRYYYTGSAWAEKFGWQTYSPTVYQNMSTTRSVHASWSVTLARYLKIGKMVHVLFDIQLNGTSVNGIGVTLPVNAAQRFPAVGAGGIFNTGGAPTQSGVASLGPGSPTDTVVFVTLQAAFINGTTGTNLIRAQLTYESLT
jgi:hypothetical protein